VPTGYWPKFALGWGKWVIVMALTLMLITCALVVARGVFQAKVAAGERERLVELTKMENVHLYFYRSQLQLDEASSKRFILAISQSPVKSQRSQPDMDAKISCKVSVGEELFYVYTIAPDEKYTDEYWVYYEGDQAQLIEVARIRSTWLTHFFSERGLLPEK
jgi:hypothetical protein